MPRIRTIKPEFCTSEQIAECSPTARLLFVLLWMFCDDAGNHPFNCKRIKMECFPGDPFTDDDVSRWIDELLRAQLLARYDSEDVKYLHVTGWHHQKIDKPSYRYPAFNSTNGSRTFDDCHPADVSSSEGSLPEGSLPEGSLNSANGSRAVGADPFASIRKLAKLWNALPKTIHRSPVVTDPIPAWLCARWQSSEDFPEQRALLVDPERLISAVEKAKGAHGEDYLTLDWLTSRKSKSDPWNAEKILSGKFDRPFGHLEEQHGKRNDRSGKPAHAGRDEQIKPKVIRGGEDF